MENRVDRTVIGALGGIIGGMGMLITMHILDFFIIDTFPKLIHIAQLFIPTGQEDTFWGKVIAHIAHFTISILLGIICINFFRLTGRDWATIKGIIFGLAIWIILYGMMGTILKIPEKGNILIGFAFIVGHLIFGIFTSWSLVWLSNRFRL